MKPKLLIINNGLKDLRGHYFETSISIAQAARDLGYQPILAAHATCQSGIIPTWVEFYPLFCTDHWMLEPPVPPPDLGGIRGELAAMSKVSIRGVLGGDATMRDYLLSRFEEVTFPMIGLPRLGGESTTPGERIGQWLPRVKRILRDLVPPVVFAQLSLALSAMSGDAGRG